MKSFMGKTLGIILSVVMMVSLVPGMAVLAATDGEGTGSEEVGEVTISEEAQKVVDMIDALPSIDEVTLDDYEAVGHAANAFSELDEAGKSSVAKALGFEKPDDVIVFFNEYSEKHDSLLEAAVKDVEDLINAIPEDLSLENADDVAAAREAYSELGGYGIQSRVSNYDKLVAAEEALEKLELVSDLDVVKEFTEQYSDLMTEKQYEELKAAIAYAEEVIASDNPEEGEIYEARGWLLAAAFEANESVGQHFSVVKDNGYVWIIDSTTGLMFEVSQLGLWDFAYDLFVDAGCLIYVDDTAVPEDGFEYEEGSIIITLMPEYLKTLSAGEHKLTLKFDNGGSIDIMFSIRNAADVASTGETVNPVVYVGAALLLAAAAAFVVNKKLAKKES